MSFSVSYAPPRGSCRWGYRAVADAPFDDWVKRGCPPNTVFTCDDIVRYYFWPAQRLAVMTSYAEFVCDITVLAQLAIRGRTIEIERLHCSRENYWADDDDDMMGVKSGDGGIGWYKTNLADLQDDALTFDRFASAFFAPDWAVVGLPLTCPGMAPELVQLAKACPTKKGSAHQHGPWGRTVGTYIVDRVAAATTIQKHFRGWQVRMATAFNPATPLGAYYAMRGFREMTVI
jgi:hypothetical protein